MSELGRLLQLILGCAVNCAAKQEYIQRIMSMEESVQHVVMTAIQEVWASLCTEHAGIFYFCCSGKVPFRDHFVQCLSVMLCFACPTCIPWNAGCIYLSGQTDRWKKKSTVLLQQWFILKIVWMGTVYLSGRNQWVRTQIQWVKIVTNDYINLKESKYNKLYFNAPGLKGLPGASSNRIIR